jgi:hypothetical protein
MFCPLLARGPRHSYGRHPATDPLARPSESVLEDRCAGGRAGTDHGGAGDRPGHPQQGRQHRAHHSRECARHYLHNSQVEHLALGRPFLYALLHTAAAGGSLRLHHPSPALERLVALTGSGSLFLTLPDALAGSRPPPRPSPLRQAAHRLTPAMPALPGGAL